MITFLIDISLLIGSVYMTVLYRRDSMPTIWPTLCVVAFSVIVASDIIIWVLG